LIRIACHICEGDPHEYYKYREFDAQNDECDECGGQGWIEKECPVCEGTGEVKESLIEPSDYDIL
jgi:DnaJ-class molecular chaperone